MKENVETTIHALLYILDRLKGEADFHKVFKLLYFADKKHLVKYGALITDDNYIAMNHGPVPSMAYDILKTLRGEGLSASIKDQFTPYFELINNFTVKAKVLPDLDYLSSSETDALDESIAENKDLDFNQRTVKSHDDAWTKAYSGEMDLFEIAKSGGASDDMLDYIKLVEEHHNLVLG